VHRPLDGVTVIEVCNVASGPFCGMLLADMGADVVKIENPSGGDQMRSWPPITNGYSENFASLNRNKRSIALDLKEPDQRDKALELMSSRDVVLENNRPGVMDRLGLGYHDVAARNPAAVYCSISAYGQTGPRRSQAGFDLTIQAISGIMSVTGEPGREPVKCGVPISDFATGLYAALGIVSALLEARQTGHGTHVDASMLGSSLAIAALQTSQLFGTGIDPMPCGSAHPRNAPYQVFACQDGYVAIAAGNNRLWASMCTALDRPDLLQDERFQTNQSRAEHQKSLKALLESHFAAISKDALLQILDRAGVPASPINSYSAALEDPQVQAMGWVEALELPDGTVTRTFGSPLRFGGAGFPAYRRPPELGENTFDLTQTERSYQ
jgi:crotonobetainyl-CoA:carnitine CoA-transferase CaiB-like acyl-CoA transferase